VNSIFIPDFPFTLPLSPDSGGEGGVTGDSHGAFYATFRVMQTQTGFAKPRRKTTISLGYGWPILANPELLR
jgi:hypothetical protein